MQRLPRFGQKGNYYDEELERKGIEKLEEFLKREKKCKKAIGTVIGNFEAVEVIEDKAGLRGQYGYIMNGKFYLFPEEALHLIGKGNLIVNDDLGQLIRNCGMNIDCMNCYGFLRREGVCLKRSKENMRNILYKASQEDLCNEFVLNKSGKPLHVKSPSDTLDPNFELVALTSLSNPALLQIQEISP
ncbi:unnamed protein product [Blepharisma stoltei]|uniref:Uncharacterized protein n=1 Tax=Blepharisma stoltei TaxID=1481888 RepID=A0AAU9JX61_9CILI|nr:unnamed protein product [Blepharisma stoltei]